MSAPLLSSVALAALSLYGHVQPRFMNDPERTGGTAHLARANSPKSQGSGCSCKAGAVAASSG